MASRDPLDVATTRLNAVVIVPSLVCMLWFRGALLPESSDIFLAFVALSASGGVLAGVPGDPSLERWLKLGSRVFIAWLVAATCWRLAYEHVELAPSALALRLAALLGSATSLLGQTTPAQRTLLNAGRLLVVAVWFWLGISSAG